MKPKTELATDGQSIWINGHPTYEGRIWNGHSIEGLLFNSRMIQALFDDSNRETCERWNYPDTGIWDAERNTEEFCQQLPTYRRHGILGITVGLQGGGSIYSKDTYGAYCNSAFEKDSSLKEPYFKRLKKVLKAADENGMVVIVSYFYVLGNNWLADRKAAEIAATRTTEWLLETDYRNIIVEVFNEASPQSGPFFDSDSIAGWLQLVRGISKDGRRLLVGNSPHPETGVSPWMDWEDISLIHTNGKLPLEAVEYVRQWKDSESFARHPRPLVVNEDSTLWENMVALLAEGVSWGFYHQGFGSDFAYDLVNWRLRPRETIYEDLSGFQTVPVNWSINDHWKKVFFSKVREITNTGSPTLPETG